MPESQSCNANSWSFPAALAIFLKFGIETPKVFLGLIPTFAIPSTASGLERDFNCFMISRYFISLFKLFYFIMRGKLSSISRKFLSNTGEALQCCTLTFREVEEILRLLR